MPIQKKDDSLKRESVVVTPVKSKRLVSYKEFISGQTLKPEFLAGFQMYLRLKGISHLSDEGWNKTLKEYQNRII